MWTHFCSHTRTFITFRIALFSKDNVYVVIFRTRHLAIDALSVADVRVVGINYKCRQTDNRTLPKAPRSRGKASQNRTVIGNLAVTSERNILVLSIPLQFV